MGSDWGEWWDGRVGVRLVLLAHDTAFNVFTHKLCEAWPSELSSDKLVRFEVTRVTGGLMVMTPGKDGAMEEVVWGNIYTAFVYQDMVIVFPV